jgi:hypothetical protein
MPTEEELEKTYSLMDTGDLAFMMANKENYTDLAIEVAARELKKRKITPEDIKALPRIEDPYKMLWMENCLFDLKTYSKAGFYFLWLPLLIMRRILSGSDYEPAWEAYRTNGYILKSQQSSFYQITGFIFFFIALIMGNAMQPFNLWPLFITWCLGFAIVFLFDIGYNRQRLTNKLNSHKETGQLPWGA